MEPGEWIELALEGRGSLSLAALVRKLVPLSDLRKLATAHGLRPKGFRVERAGARQLGDLLAEQFLTNDRLRQELAERISAATRIEASTEETEPAKPSTQDVAALSYRLERAERAAKTERTSASKARRSLEESVELRNQVQREVENLTRQLNELERNRAAEGREVERLRARCEELASSDSEALLVQLREEGEEHRRSDDSQRRAIAELTSRARELELLVAELESYLPRGQKQRLKLKRKEQASEVPAAGWLPCYTDDFLNSLEELENEPLRRVHAAVAQLVLQGPEYPGLHAKALKGGGDLWSIRAGVHHRVYFQRDGNRVVLQHAGTREDQETYLKKFLHG